MPIFRTQEEWRTFWRRGYTILFRAAWVILRNEADADDAVQDAIESLSKHHDTRSEIPEIPLLVTVVRRRAIDILRKRLRHPEVELTDDIVRDLDPEERGLNPREELLLQSFPDEVRQLAEKLPPRLKRLFLFFLRHSDNDPEEHWSLWAAENGLDPDNRTQRNSHFDVPKKLLRKKLIALDIYKLLKGKE